MRQWFENLPSAGPGYIWIFTKTAVVVQSSDLPMVNDMFCDLGVKVVTGSEISLCMAACYTFPPYTLWWFGVG